MDVSVGLKALKLLALDRGENGNDICRTFTNTFSFTIISMGDTDVLSHLEQTNYHASFSQRQEQSHHRRTILIEVAVLKLQLVLAAMDIIYL